MGETGVQLRRARESAIAQLDAHLIKEHQAVQLKPPSAARFGHFSGAWVIPINVAGKRFEIAMVVREAFPFEPPELHFVDQSFFLRFPHVDEKGKICLTNAIATFSPNQFIRTADFLIGETQKLIDDSLAGRNAEDFVDEFLSYWTCLLPVDRKPFWSLLNPAPSTRHIYYYSANAFTLFGESEAEIKTWLKNYNGGILPKGFNTKTSVLIWLPKPLLPELYPKTAHDILLLARESAYNADILLQQVIPSAPGALSVVFGFQTKRGPVLAGVQISEPKKANGTTKRNRRHDGFRPGHVPMNVLLARYFGESKLLLSEVMRVDSEWCLTRGGPGYDKELLNKRVAIVGCGSLGAEIASILAKSGVGRFVLIDNDLLGWGNVARHLLGGDDAGQPKASRLASHLASQMPWLDVTSESRQIESIIYKRPALLQECDLIISTTGDWTSDCLLNSAHKTFARFPPLVFGWTEPFGIAGHALGVLSAGGCLACGMNEFGVFAHRVTEWPKENHPMIQATGCSDFFQPYSVADVAPTKAIIAELALDVLRRNVREGTLRTWIGKTQRLASLGGHLHEGWREKVIPDQSDCRAFFQPWLINPKCPLCN